MKKGTLVFWEIENVRTNAEALGELGFGKEFMPRNDSGTAITKAVNRLCKDNDTMSRRFRSPSSAPHTISFGVFSEQIDGSDLQMNREMIVTHNSVTGTLTKVADPAGLFAELDRLYGELGGYIDTTQFRNIVMKVLGRSHAFPMRKRGGIYFIDKRFDDEIPRLRMLIESQRGCKLHEIVINDESGALDALQAAASDSLIADIQQLQAQVQKRFDDGEMATKPQLLSDRAKMKALTDELEIHREILRLKAADVQAKADILGVGIDKLFKAVEAGIVEQKTFMEIFAEWKASS